MYKNNIRYERNDSMEITWEQQKIISSPFRSRLIALLYEEAMTPKQIADLVDKNPGTVYYHIQQLLKHNILEVEKTKTNKGIVEKYYRARAVSFRNIEQRSPDDYIDGGKSNLYLSKDLVEKLKTEMSELFFKYGHLSYKEKDTEKQNEYTFEYLIKKFKEDEEQ